MITPETLLTVNWSDVPLLIILLLIVAVVALQLGYQMGEHHGRILERRRWLTWSTAEREAERLRWLNRVR